MESYLRQLSQTYSTNSSSITHLVLPDKLPITIPTEYYARFWPEYCSVVQRAEQEATQQHQLVSTILSLAELSGTDCTLLADLTFRFDICDEEDWEPLPEQFVLQIVYAYQRAINKHLQIVDPTKAYNVVVLGSRAMHRVDNCDLLQMRIQFPYLRCSHEAQCNIRDQVLLYLRENNVFGRLERSPLQNWDSIIDKPSMGQAIVMYGCSLYKNYPLLQIDHCYREITYQDDPISNQGYFVTGGEFTIYDVFAINLHSHEQNGIVERNSYDQYPLVFLLPYLLSIYYCSTITRSKSNTFSTSSTTVETNEVENVIMDNPDPIVHYDLVKPSNIVREILQHIAIFHFYNYDDWLCIGQALAHTDRSDDMRDFWLRTCHQVYSYQGYAPKFIKLDRELSDYEPVDNSSPILRLPVSSSSSSSSFSSDKYDIYDSDHDLQIIVVDQWRLFYENKRAITHNTILWWFKQNNPEQYILWKEKRHYYYFSRCLKNTTQEINEYDFSLHLYELYGMYHVSVSPNNWYYYKDHHWTNDDGTYFRICITEKFMREYIEEQSRISEAMKYLAEGEEKNKWQNYLTKVARVILYLSRYHHHSALFGFCTKTFHNHNFEKYLDNNNYITGVKNGVFRVQGSQILFDTGRPEDYISKQTAVGYDCNLSWDNKRVKEIERWFEEMFVNRELIMFVSLYVSSCFIHGNIDKIFAIFTGEGDNSKTMFELLLECIFGEYLVKIPIAVLTNKNQRNASGPNPELAQCSGALWVVTEEANKDEELNKQLIKILTGSDTFFARFLNKNGGKVKPTYKTILVCNKVPRIRDVDGATENRVTVVPFDSTWVTADKAPTNRAEQLAHRLFPMKRNFQHHIPFLGPAALWYFFHAFPTYQQQGLQKPELVVKRTMRYWNEADEIYENYIRDHILDGDQTYTIHKDILINDFRQWYIRACPGKKLISSLNIEEYFTKIWGIPDDIMCWRGHTIRIPEMPTANNTPRNMNEMPSNIPVNTNSNVTTNVPFNTAAYVINNN